MAVLNVVEIGNPLLAKKAERIHSVSDFHRSLANDLIETMYFSPGSVGIAAPQVGISVSMFVLDVSDHKKTNISHGLVVMINPEVISESAFVVLREGCMSVPHLTGDVRRASELVVRGQDLDGNERVITTDGFEARAFLHEIDHLSGKLFLDRVEGPHALYKRKRYQ